MEELKTKIRRDRILEIMEYRLKHIPRSRAYYKSIDKPLKTYSLNGVTEEDIINSKNDIIKKDCIRYLTELVKYTKTDISVLHTIKDMNIDDSLHFTYRTCLLNQIYGMCPTFERENINNISTDELEEIFDKVNSDYQAEKEKREKKSLFSQMFNR